MEFEISNTFTNMKISWSPYTLQFRHPFTVATFSRTTTPIVIVKIEHLGQIGYGEASMPPYLGESQESVINFLSKIDLSKFESPFNTEEILRHIDQLENGNNAAKASIDIALHDLQGKLLNRRTIDILNIKEKPALSSFTIGIDTIEKMLEKVDEAEKYGFKILKIKAGTPNDRAMISAIVKKSCKAFSIDVNQGWIGKEKALDMAYEFKEMGCLFIEQPFTKENMRDSAWLTERSPIPIIADESVKRLCDLKAAKDIFHGINVKLMKSTGIQEALKMIETARSFKMNVVLGCMSESSCAISAAAILSSLADWIDLDGPYLITNDLFSGMEIKEGKVSLQNKYGIGIENLTI